MILALILGLLVLAVLFGWAAGKVRSLAMAVVLQMGCFIFLALAVIVAGAAITGGGGMNYHDRNLLPGWAQEQGGCIVGVLLTLAMIGVAVMR